MADERAYEKYATWLVIPYFDEDTGIANYHRPLSSPGVPSPKPTFYLCPSIKVNGGPLRRYTPGEPTTVEVTVANLGGGAHNAGATVMVWWVAPGPSFASPTIFGAGKVEVRSHGGKASATVVGTIPVGSPPHVCLLVGVRAPADPGLKGVGIAPGTDRHWAQLNLDSAVTDQNGQFFTRFIVANTSDRRKTFHVSAAEPHREFMDVLNESLGLDVTGDAPLSWIMTGPDGEATEGRAALRIDLAPGQTEQVRLEGRISSPLEPGTGRVIEITQHSPADMNFDVQGALGIVVTTEEI